MIQRTVDTCATKPLNEHPSTDGNSRPLELNSSTVVHTFHAGKRCLPDNAIYYSTSLDEHTDISTLSAKYKDFRWFLCRMNIGDGIFNTSSTNDNAQIIPAWSAFNTVAENNVPRQSTVGYCPVIDASPTELSTVYTVLKRSVNMADQLDQHDVVVVFNQAIYAKSIGNPVAAKR